MPLKNRVLSIACGLTPLISGHCAAADDQPRADDEIEIVRVIGVDSRSTATSDSLTTGLSRAEKDIGRTISTLSRIDRDVLNLNSIHDLATVVSGVNNTSSFGTEGSLDIRGSYADLFYNGYRRLTNPGNYPTNLRLYESVEVLKGPSTSQWGMSRIGGSVNLTPALNTTGQEALAYTATLGSYDDLGLQVEALNSVQLGGRDIGLALNASARDANSFYRNHFQKDYFLAASGLVPIAADESLEISLQLQRYRSNQITGWNRLTQDLIDRGTYITGRAQPLDTDGDGKISGTEITTAGGLGGFGTGLGNNCCGPQFVDPSLIPTHLALVDIGEATLSPRTVMVDSSDFLNTDVALVNIEHASGNLVHGLYAEALDMDIETGIGFSNRVRSSVVEYRASYGLSDLLGFSNTVTLAARYTDAENAIDFFNQFFDRRDLTVGATAADTMLLATQQQNPTFAQHYVSSSLNTGLTWTLDANITESLKLDGSVRLNHLRAISKGLSDSASFTNARSEASEAIAGFHIGLVQAIGDDTRLYASMAKTHSIGEEFSSVIVPDLYPDNIVGEAELMELGVKGNNASGSFRYRLAAFRQKNLAVNTQDAVVNSTIESEGFEFDFQLQLNDVHSVALNGSHNTVTTLGRDSQFSYFGAADLPQIDDPSIFFGGTLSGLHTASRAGQRAGIPKDRINLIYRIRPNSHWLGVINYAHVSEVFSGYSQALRLPDYGLLNAAITYASDAWQITASGRNLQDSRGFISNTPDIFGNVTVLPIEGRTFQLRIGGTF
jgi:iron complex outermembrane receptor protein